MSTEEEKQITKLKKQIVDKYGDIHKWHELEPILRQAFKAIREEEREKFKKRLIILAPELMTLAINIYSKEVNKRFKQENMNIIINPEIDDIKDKLTKHTENVINSLSTDKENI